MSTLSFERGTAFTANQVRLAKIVEDLIDYARDACRTGRPPAAIADDEIARRLATRARLGGVAAGDDLRQHLSKHEERDTPGPRGSISS